VADTRSAVVAIPLEEAVADHLAAVADLLEAAGAVGARSADEEALLAAGLRGLSHEAAAQAALVGRVLSATRAVFIRLRYMAPAIALVMPLAIGMATAIIRSTTMAAGAITATTGCILHGITGRLFTLRSTTAALI
jgi:hypothetical protein